MLAIIFSTFYLSFESLKELQKNRLAQLFHFTNKLRPKVSVAWDVSSCPESRLRQRPRLVFFYCSTKRMLISHTWHPCNPNHPIFLCLKLILIICCLLTSELLRQLKSYVYYFTVSTEGRCNLQKWVLNLRKAMHLASHFTAKVCIKNLNPNLLYGPCFVH